MRALVFSAVLLVSCYAQAFPNNCFHKLTCSRLPPPHHIYKVK
jgi:hypothetical protein